MRKVRLFIASSLDGYIAREDGSVDWLFSDADYGYSEFYGSIDTVVMGRKTYEKSLEFEERPFRGKKVHVFSRSAKKKGVEFVSDVVGFMKKLVRSKGKDIWLVGGSEIVSIFLNEGLIDEIILSIHPVILGRGITLFKKVQKDVWLKMQKSVSFDSGLVQIHYVL
ncbi:MAG: dihydrofolate reductase family protein [Thaumarchaeota archaeon]|nr:dihydrofolate reductase family protein [Nitrososphaerota archaeon]